jgi:hypothetical protein
MKTAMSSQAIYRVLFVVCIVLLGTLTISSCQSQIPDNNNKVIPAAPSELIGTAKADTEIDLSWKDNSGNEDGFKIEKKTGSSGSWGALTTVTANQQAYQDTSVIGNTTYYYRVKAYNQNGNSPSSNEVNATTPAAPEAKGNIGQAGGTVEVTNPSSPLFVRHINNNIDKYRKFQSAYSLGVYCRSQTN